MKATTFGGERVLLTDNTRDVGHGLQIEVVYQDGSKGWEHDEDLIDRDETISDFTFKVEDGQIVADNEEGLIAFIEGNAVERIGFGQDAHSLPDTPTVAVFKMAKENHVECNGTMCEAITIYYNSNEMFLTDDFEHAVDLEEDANERGKGFEF